MSFKKIIGKLHLWLGLTSGLVVLVVCITGCIYAFQVEIQELTQAYRKVEVRNESFLPPSRLKEIAILELPGRKIHGVQYSERNRSAIVSFYDADPEYYYLIYVNPYSGQVLKVKDMDQDFFRLVLMGHYYLWLPPAIGKPIVASATLIFLVMLISGIILWWPRNKGATKQRFSIKWSARWRRKNYDLHNVLGFYMTWVVVFIAFTGLVWGFEWFSKSTYWAISGGKPQLDYNEPESGTTNIINQTSLSSVDRAWYKMKAENKPFSDIEVHFPESKQSSILVVINPDPSTLWKSDYRFFDQYTLKELKVNHMWGRSKDLATADKIFRMNYDIHVGAILGLPGKILAFFASLIAASLPVTGLCIYLGRRKKLKSNNRNERQNRFKNSQKKEFSPLIMSFQIEK